MRRLIASTVLAVLLMPLAAQAQTQQKYTLSPVRIGQLKTYSFFYTSAQATSASLGAVVGKSMNDLDDVMKAGAFMPAGAPVIVYHSSGPVGDQTIAVEAGFPVTGEPPAGGDFKLGEVKSALAAISLYTGPPTQIGAAYRTLYGKVLAGGHVPTDERREHYLYWEDDNSPNNVIMIEILLDH
jgi:effector-binding domain-containing protein